MRIFRKKTIFHVEESMPDPEELKIRFRRRILLITLIGFFLILGVPVIHALKPELRLRNETRIIAEKIMEARLYSMQSRVPISLQLEADNQTWKRIFHLPGTLGCGAEALGPSESLDPQGITWSLRLRKENGEELAGRTLCMHPLFGMMLDTTPVDHGVIFLTAISHTESGETTYTKGIGIGAYGSEITLLSQ